MGGSKELANPQITARVSQTDIPSKKVLDLNESKKIVDRECRFLSLELI